MKYKKKRSEQHSLPPPQWWVHHLNLGHSFSVFHFLDCIEYKISHVIVCNRNPVSIVGHAAPRCIFHANLSHSPVQLRIPLPCGVGTIEALILQTIRANLHRSAKYAFAVCEMCDVFVHMGGGRVCEVHVTAMLTGKS